MVQQDQNASQNVYAVLAANCVCFSFRKASRALTQLYDDLLQPSGLRSTQFNLLVAIAVAGKAPITILAKELIMDRTTLTRNLRPLEVRGLVEIVPGPDRRTRFIVLTSKGYQALEKARPFWEQAQAIALGQLGAEQWPGLTAALEAATILADLP